MARLGVAVAIFIAVLMFEIRGITRARHPMLRAGVAMAVVIPLFLFFFAWIYLNMSNADAGDLRWPHGPHDRAVLHRHGLLHRGVRRHHPQHRSGPDGLTTVQMLADLAVDRHRRAA